MSNVTGIAQEGAGAGREEKGGKRQTNSFNFDNVKFVLHSGLLYSYL
jgi:hypothetical protein